MMKKLLILLLLPTLFVGNIFSQAALCEDSEPFCTSDIYTFPAGTGGTAQAGPDYGCLVTQSNPAWFHMKIKVAGNIIIEMSSTPSKDIDFICWGPFSDPYDPCTSALTDNMIVDCSFSYITVETCEIPDGQVDEYYILLITNYSDDPCDITFQKIGGTGETDCDIVAPPVSNNSPICVHDNLELYAESVNNATYAWSGPAGFTSTQQNPIISDVGLENAGIYELIITVGGSSSDPVETTAIINALPSSDFSFSNLCFGDTTIFTDQSTVDPPSSTITAWNWDFGDGQQATGQNQTHIYSTAGDFSVTLTTYTDTMQCESSIIKIVTIYNAPNVNAGDDINIPYGATTQLNGTVDGGSGSYIFDWQPEEKLFDNTIEDPITVNLIETTTFTLAVEDESSNCVNSDEVTVIIDGESMLLSIITDHDSVCLGNSAIIEAVATEGSGSYTYTWTSNPPGINLTTRIITVTPDVTTTYLVEVTDGYTTLNDQVTITVLPSPQANAGDDITIPGGWTTQLDGSISGGSGNYDILWQPQNLLDDPTIINPTTVQLWETEIFTLNVTDSDYGCTSTDNMTVIISGGELLVTATADPMTICQDDIVYLNAIPTGGSGNYEYSWVSNPAGFTSNIKEPTDFPQVTTTYTVTVFDGQNTEEASVTVTVHQKPIVDAGEDITIPTGSITTLNGNINGGSGNYDILWQPENLLEDPTIVDPTTVQLWITEVFTLNVTDSNFGCTNSDNMTVIITGDVLQVTATANPVPLCQGDTVNLDAQPTGGSGNYEYTWTSDPAGFTSNIKEPTDIPQVTTTYTVSVFDGQDIVEASVTVEVNPVPIVNAVDDITIPNGWTAQLDGDISGGSGNYNILWQPENLLEDPTIIDPTTVQLWTTEVFTLTASDSYGCTSSDEMTVIVTGGELQVTTIADPSIICQNDIVDLNALPIGGSGNNEYTWTSDPTGFTANIKEPSDFPQVTTIYTVSVFDGQNTAQSSVTVEVNPRPIGNAGTNMTINIGTSAIISGASAVGGTGAYEYFWSPPNSLIDHNVIHPQTVVLNESTEFTLTVTDVNGCSSIADNMFVFLGGDELSVFPTSSAMNNTICQGENITLFPNALGGGDSYTYSWSSITGYSSNTESPIVSPLETTTYTIEVNDTYTTITDSITIFVNHTPIVNLIPQDVTILAEDTVTVCVRDTIRIDAGGDPLNPPAMNYLWSTAATTQSINTSTNGNWVAVDTYWVSVENPITFCSTNDTITVVFDFQECNIGIDNNNSYSYISINPNPAKDYIQLKITGLSGNINISLSNIQGKIFWQEDKVTTSNKILTEEINLDYLPKGVYIISVVSNLGVLNSKLIKQ